MDRPSTVKTEEEYRPYQRWIATAEAARKLKVSPKTVARWAKEGKLEYQSTLGGHRRYKRVYIDEMAARLTRGEPWI